MTKHYVLHASYEPAKMNTLIKPLTGQVLVEILPAEKRSAGGVDLPEHTLSPEENQAAARRPDMPLGLTGVVRAIGAWPKTEAGLARMPEFGLNAKVIIGPNAGLDLHGLGRKLKIVNQDQILALLT